jgi:endonuclease IV
MQVTQIYLRLIWYIKHTEGTCQIQQSASLWWTIEESFMVDHIPICVDTCHLHLQHNEEEINI